MAYVAQGAAGLRIYDVSDPGSPQERGSLDTPGNATGLDLINDFALVTDGVEGLRIIDVSQVSAPREVGAIDTPGYASDVAYHNGYAWVADEWDGVRIIDITTPSSPFEAASLALEGEALAIQIAAGVAYLATYDGGLEVLDADTPTAPHVLGYYRTGDLALGVAVDADNVHIADRADGLYVLRYGETGVPWSEGSGVQTLLMLGPCQPNPSSRYTTIPFTLSAPAAVTLSVFECSGRRIQILESGQRGAGTHQITWHVAPMAAGTYFFRLTVDGVATGTTRAIVVK